MLQSMKSQSLTRLNNTATNTNSIFNFFKEPPYGSQKWLYQFTFSPTMQEGSFFSTPSPAFIVCRFFK